MAESNAGDFHVHKYDRKVCGISSEGSILAAENAASSLRSEVL